VLLLKRQVSRTEKVELSNTSLQFRNSYHCN
jgi:hypothetical protein